MILFNKQLKTSMNDATKKQQEQDKVKVVSGIDNKKLATFISKKVDEFYDDLINYAQRMSLPHKLNQEIKFYDKCQSRTVSDVIDNFSAIQKQLKEYDSPFYSLSFLYAVKITENKIVLDNLYRNIMFSWEETLIEKALNYRMIQLENLRQKMQRQFFNKIRIIKKKKKILNVFPDYFNFFWDLTNNRINNMKLNNISRYQRYLNDNPAIKKIADYLGRRLERDNIKQRTVVIKKATRKWNPNGKEEIYGVHESNELEHIVPAEVVYLNNKMLLPIFLKKFAEKKLYTFEFWKEKLVLDKTFEKDLIKKNKGDVIICVDTSLSMAGPHEYIAKVITFAIIKNIIDYKSKRRCILINFSENFKMFNVQDIINAPAALEAFLEESFHGGTNLDGAMFEAIKYMDEAQKNYKNCDVLMISDFNAPVFSQIILNKMKLQREYYNEFYAIQIGTSGNSQLTKMFRDCWVYNPRDPFTSQKILKLLTEYNSNYKNAT